MNSEYNLESFDESHYSKFKILYRNAFGKTISIDECKRRFDTKARGLEFVGFIALQGANGMAVAFYGVFPLKIKTGQSVMLAAISGDTMTHSQHRKKGLFLRLAAMTFEKCRKLGIVLVFGFPNNQSYYGFTRHLGWQHSNDLTEWNFSFRFKISPVHKLLKHATFLRPLFTAYARLLLNNYIVTDIDSFDNSHGETYGIVRRDRDYINYKRGNERIFIKIDNVIIWVRLSELLWIGDFSDLGQVNQSVLKKIKKIARLLGYNSIRYAVNKEISLPEAMKDFKAIESIPLCLKYLEEERKFPELLFTTADFDNW
jgi:hypothetical protein